MEKLQDLNSDSQREVADSEEFKRYQRQRAIHMDELSAKIDRVLSHQHELLALSRHASKTNMINSSIPNEIELRAADCNLAIDATPHFPTLKSLLGPYGLLRNLAQVLGPNILAAFNYDGLSGMQCFRDYKALNAAIFDAVKQDGYTERVYAADMRNNSFGFHKNRVFKQSSGNLLRQKKDTTIVNKME